MNKKIKILFDGQLLAKILIQDQTGIFRVTDELFKGLANHPEVELYFLMTNKKGSAKDYLENRGLDNLIPNIVYAPKLLLSSKTRKLFHKIYGGLLRKVLPFIYKKRLGGFDWYLSTYPSISPVISKLGIKTFSIIHDIIPLLYPNFAIVYKKQLKNFCNLVDNTNSDIVSFDSISARDDFLRYRYPFDFSKTMVTYLGKSEDFTKQDKVIVERAKEKYKISNNPYILCVGEGNPRKNFSHTINSFIRYIENEKDDDLRLVVVGKSLPKYDYRKDGISDFEKYKNKIIITGYVDGDDLPALYTGASIFMYPSLYEGFGLPLLEGFGCEVPIITASNSSLLEIGSDAVEYVSGFDVNETARAITKLLSDKDYRDDLVKKGLKRSELFSWDKMTNQIINEILNYNKKGV